MTTTDTPSFEDPAWSLDLAATAVGVDLVLVAPVVAGVSIRVALDRNEARYLARCLLAASGDATERTFPHPMSPEAARG